MKDKSWLLSYFLDFLCLGEQILTSTWSLQGCFRILSTKCTNFLPKMCLIEFLNFLKFQSLLTHFLKFLRKFSEIKDFLKNFLKRDIDHFHTFDKYPLHFGLVFGIITTLPITFNLTNANYPFFKLCHFTHIGKLSGNDSGDFPGTFSEIYDFKWNFKFRKFGLWLAWPRLQSRFYRVAS